MDLIGAMTILELEKETKLLIGKFIIQQSKE